MPTLSIVKTDFGKILKWGGIALGAIIILFILLKFLLFVKELILPSSPPPPTVTFGKLSEIYFPDGIKKDFTYQVDTISGELPAFPISERVYKMEQKGPDILAVEHASQKVTDLGFNSRPEQISDFVYKWRNSTPPDQNLIMNIKLAEFNLTSSFLSYESLLNSRNFKDKSEPIESASGFLRTIGLYPDDIDPDKTKVDFATLQDGVIRPSTRAVTSNVATVYFFQKAKDDLPIKYPEGVNSSMRLMVGGGEIFGKIIDGKFSHQNILDESATYPIKSAQEAFDDLKNGKGYVASYSGESSNVKIKNVYLARYYEGKLQKYMTPVVVFEGNDGFVAYVPAVKDEWIDK